MGKELVKTKEVTEDRQFVNIQDVTIKILVAPPVNIEALNIMF